eukprot:TRINITY_DN4119_c0_g1_i3.p1 TRINITY_DN4119_c0_g1~~TRINITY_DN4119_c0_g1_i3.p1  ORF type:complete len:518 (+),score=68.78 TRINITY_DN4119_c0_g1_i3:110-1555(+)
MASFSAVWEWLDDYGFWAEFDPDAGDCLEAGWAQSTPRVPLYLLPYEDASHDAIFDSQDGWMEDPDSPAVLRQLRRIQSTPSDIPLWKWWHQETSVWHAHDAATSALIEQSWVQVAQSSAQNRALTQGAFPITVNGKATRAVFATEGWQENRDTLRRRGIRRRWPMLLRVPSANPDAPPSVGVNPAHAATSLGAMAVNNNGNGGNAPQSVFRTLGSLFFSRFGGAGAAAQNGGLNYPGGASAPTAIDPALPYDAEKTFVPVDAKDLGENEDCVVCFDALIETESEASSNCSSSSSSGHSREGSSEIVKLSNCVHAFHRRCIEQWFKRRLSCPECTKLYGTIFGTQPVAGASMFVDVHPYSDTWRIEGFADTGVIEMTFMFDDGIQGPEHPKPGMAYTGTVRTAFLPDNGPGQEILKLLQVAWDRRLLFTVGRSASRNVDNTVCWNGIHLKTSLKGGPTCFGYPDETYFARVKGELRDQGVF